MEPSAHAQELAVAAAAERVDDVSGTQEVKPRMEPRWLVKRLPRDAAGGGAREWERSWARRPRGPASRERALPQHGGRRARVIYGLEFQVGPERPWRARCRRGHCGEASGGQRPRLSGTGRGPARRPGAAVRLKGPRPWETPAAWPAAPGGPWGLTLTARLL